MAVGLRGTYRGWPSSLTADSRLPKRLARAESAGSSQTGITAEVDITGLSVNFSVSDFPVKVRLYHPFVYSGADLDQILMSITDAANVVKGATGFGASGAAGLNWLMAEEEILVPGSYTRKGRIKRNTGSGSANVYTDAFFIAYIEAFEFED